MKSIVSVVLLLVLSSSVLCLNKTFLPTYEWEVVAEDEAIPAGLHVRINFETGKKEAKLIRESEETDTRQSALLSVDHENHLKYKELKKILKKIKDDSGQSVPTEENRFRSYEDLKRELETSNIFPMSDADLMKDIMVQYRYFSSKETYDSNEVISILQDLEYLVHQYDNAIEFAKLDGFSTIVIPILNNTDESHIRQEALLLLGSAAQNNPNVQSSAVKTGCIGTILRVMVLDHQNTDTISRAVYAISCILRNFPNAQMAFFREGGLAILSNLFDGNTDSNVKIKIARLLTDLLFETEEGLGSQSKMEQYSAVIADLNLREYDWCKRSKDWFYSRVTLDDLASAEDDLDIDHYMIEATIEFMQALAKACIDDFVTDIELLNIVNHAMKYYEELSLKEMDDGDGEFVFGNIHKKLQMFAATLVRTTVFRDEL